MALSAAPPPPDPPLTPTTTAEATTTTPTTTARPLFQNPPRPSNPLPFYMPSTRLPSNPNPNYAQLAPRPPHPHPHDPSQLLYPVASSGRGFLHRPVTLPASRPVSRPPLVFPYGDPGQGNMGFVRPTYLHHTHLGSAPVSVAVTAAAAPASGTGGGVIPGIVKGIPVSISHQPKVGLPPVSASDRHNHSDPRNKDDTLAVIRDRKVRISDNASLYSLCRSWLRNGFPDETQPQHVDAIKSLPRPLPAAALVFDSPEKRKGNKEEGDEFQDEESVEHLSMPELLQRHVKRAKRVRTRLKEERLRRISRYKTRLGLLLPPMGEQPLKIDSGPAN